LSSARASYFHKSIGGYHAAKPRRMQQLFDYQIAKKNMEVLDMLNVKYVIQTDKEGKEIPTQNPMHNGNAWFIQNVKWVQNADEEMKALDSLSTKNVAVINKKEFGSALNKSVFLRDSLATLTLQKYKSNDLKYSSNNTNEGLAIFSEMYYAEGWNAYIDGHKTPHLRADYVLRALPIPAGKHTIEFKFEPQVVKTGSTISFASSLGIVLLIVGGLYYERKKIWYAKKE
jgi:Bacterial membrane protein YfhO